MMLDTDAKLLWSKYGEAIQGMWNATRYIAGKLHDRQPPSVAVGVTIEGDILEHVDIGYEKSIIVPTIAIMSQNFDFVYYTSYVRIERNGTTTKGVAFQVITKDGLKLFGLCSHSKCVPYFEKYSKDPDVERTVFLSWDTVGYGHKQLENNEWVFMPTENLVGGELIQLAIDKLKKNKLEN